jgi:hypothetical protein
MTNGRRLSLITRLGLGVMIVTGISLVTSGAIAALGHALGGRDARDDSVGWIKAIAAVDTALARGDVSRAATEWYPAYVATLYRRQSWDCPIEVGDAWLRIQRAAGFDAVASKTRQLYLTALFRAREARSVTGVLRAAAAFEALGDHHVAAQARQIAAGLQARERAVADTARHSDTQLNTER